MSHYKTLGLLPVRGGSLGLPGKNSRPLKGKPLLAWPAETLAEASGIDFAFCSTDSPHLAAIAISSGLEAYPLRPANLATSESLVIDTVRYVLAEQRDHNREFEQVVLVQATSPFVKPWDIQRALSELDKPNVDSVISVTDVPDDYHPSLMYRISNESLVVAGDQGESFRRRQDRSKWFRRVGLLVAAKVANLSRYDALVGGNTRFVEVEASRAVNIDDEEDFRIAERFTESFE